MLTLNYNWNGCTPAGKDIVNGLWMFTHIDCYLGADRTWLFLIIMKHISGISRSFPGGIRDMYTQTDKDGINFDNRPPRADIMGYSRADEA